MIDIHTQALWLVYAHDVTLFLVYKYDIALYLIYTHGVAVCLTYMYALILVWCSDYNMLNCACSTAISPCITIDHGLCVNLLLVTVTASFSDTLVSR